MRCTAQKLAFVAFFGSCMILLGVTPASAIPTNLAPGGTATASSAYAGDEATYGAAHANNGNRAGDDIYHSANDNVNPAWWEIDLGADYYLDRVQIAPRDLWQGLVENFTLEVRDNSNAVVFSQTFLPNNATDDGGPSFWATNVLRNTVGRTVRIARNDADPGAMTFAEFEVYGQNTPILQNLALGQPATATPPLTGYEQWVDVQAANGNDGNLDGSFWHGSVYHSDPSVTPFAGHFWQVELEDISEIDYVTFYARSDYIANRGFAKLSILDENGQLVPGTEQELDLTTVNSFDFTHDYPANTLGKFVRIETLSENLLEVTELEVFGTSTVTQIPGDFDTDGDVDGDDFARWQMHFPMATDAEWGDGDGDGDGDVDGADFVIWQTNFPSLAPSASIVPEPHSAMLMVFGVAAIATFCQKRRGK